jgi:hypothetical protein
MASKVDGRDEKKWVASTNGTLSGWLGWLNY